MTKPKEEILKDLIGLREKATWRNCCDLGIGTKVIFSICFLTYPLIILYGLVTIYVRLRN